MPCEKNVIYLYDGSFEGMLCCVYESVYCREVPLNILPRDEAAITLFEQRYVATDEEKAARVYASIPRRIGSAAAELVRDVFLSCAQEKEMMILLFLLMGYQTGPRLMRMHGNPALKPLESAQIALKNEVHLLLGFVRFSDYNGTLVAAISPKNYVLPYLQPHFCGRLGREDFLIYDRVHKAALLNDKDGARIVTLEKLETPPASPEEEAYRALWKRFYDTIAIAARANPKCRMTHMPKRYWDNMCEMCPELPEAQRPPALEQARAHAEAARRALGSAQGNPPGNRAAL